MTHGTESTRVHPAPAGALCDAFRQVRSWTEHLAAPLSAEDQVIQSMPDVSPCKWHRAHVTWFFETFVLKPHVPGYREYHPDFAFLFNSYYVSLGDRHRRPERGLVSRPSAAEVGAYRAWVDEAMVRLMSDADDALLATIEPLVVLGLHHEQQHQELMLMDIKHVFWSNPLRPAYRDETPPVAVPDEVQTEAWLTFDGGRFMIGSDIGSGSFRFGEFAYDNEGPRHEVLLGDFRLATMPVTNADYLAFIADGGYRTPALWLSDGWDRACAEDWQAPLYWEQRDGQWWHMTLHGMQPVDPRAPVCHVSFYEAQAFALWAGHRLPTEAEWERVAAEVPVSGNFVASGALRPVPPAAEADAPAALFGDVWEWTASPYTPYPGYRAPAGAVGEYNGKFMINQMVMRGGACVTPQSHMRSSYRNFFYPHMRWQFGGIRLAADA